MLGYAKKKERERETETEGREEGRRIHAHMKKSKGEFFSLLVLISLYFIMKKSIVMS